jgi:Phosphotransferase enzyme family
VAALSGAPREPLLRLAEHLEGELSGLPRGFGHGDFWRKNMLVVGSRLLGVADWERAGDGRLPLLDLLQLTATQSPYARRGLGALVTDRLLPWAKAGGDADGRHYCEQVGVEPSPRVLRALVLAFWLDRLAREVEKCGDKGGTPAWRATNIDPVLAAPEARA